MSDYPNIPFPTHSASQFGSTSRLGHLTGFRSHEPAAYVRVQHEQFRTTARSNRATTGRTLPIGLGQCLGFLGESHHPTTATSPHLSNCLGLECDSIAVLAGRDTVVEPHGQTRYSLPDNVAFRYNDTHVVRCGSHGDSVPSVQTTSIMLVVVWTEHDGDELGEIAPYVALRVKKAVGVMGTKATALPTASNTPRVEQASTI
jgi:hypothetical protein